jgi:hypothetical protein
VQLTDGDGVGVRAVVGGGLGEHEGDAVWTEQPTSARHSAAAAIDPARFEVIKA